MFAAVRYFFLCDERDDHQIPNIKVAVEEHEDADRLTNVPFLRHLLRHVLPQMAAGRRRRRIPRRTGLNLANIAFKNLDLAVLRPENQNPTHVTPLIESLATGLFLENLVVVGPRPVPRNEDAIQRLKRLALLRLRRLMEKAFQHKKLITFTREQRLHPRSQWYKSVMIDRETYSVRVD